MNRKPTAEEMAGALGLRRGPPPPGAVEATLRATQERLRTEIEENRRLRNAGLGLVVAVGALLLMAIFTTWRHHRAMTECAAPIVLMRSGPLAEPLKNAPMPDGAEVWL